MNQTLNPDLFYNDRIFKDLRREALKELKNKEIRIHSFENSKQNIPEYQKAFNRADLVNRKGSGIYAPIPYEINKSRNLDWSYDGRFMVMLNSLKQNSKYDYPDVITAYPRKQIGVL